MCRRSLCRPVLCVVWGRLRIELWILSVSFCFVGQGIDVRSYLAPRIVGLMFAKPVRDSFSRDEPFES